MTKQDKKKFVRDLMKSLTLDIINKVEAMPDEWDGHELRMYIAERVDNEANYLRRDKGMRKRLREYRNAVIVHNL